MDFDYTCTSRLLGHVKELSVPYLQNDGWILTKLVHLYCSDMEKNIRFGNLDPIFKVT